MAHTIDVPELKDYKYAIIIDGLAYVLAEYPSIEYNNDRIYIRSGSEIDASLSATASWVIVPYEDWTAAHGPGSWPRS